MKRLDRYYRLLRTHALKRGGVKKLWTSPGELNEERLNEPEDLKLGYYLDFSSDADYSGPFNCYGIPMIDYGGEIGVQYNPWAIGHFGLAIFHRFLKRRDPYDHSLFMKLADWFVAHGQRGRGDLILWVYTFDWPPLLSAPWFSALAQSIAISVLLRAYLWSKNETYLSTARGAFLAFTRSVEEGGVSLRDPSGHLFFEETVPVTVYHILNGFISALWGIHEYQIVTRDSQASLLFDEGLRSLEYYLPQYDVGWASLYSLDHVRRKRCLKDVASLFYQKLHVQQLNVLYRLTGKNVFDQYRRRWEGYLKSRSSRWRTLMAKALFKLFYY